MPMNAAKLLLLNVLGGSAADFSPLDIPGLVLWLDASDAATLFQDSAGTTPATADGDVVGYWADKSGNGRNATQGTTANKPRLKLAVKNGLNVVRGDGSDDVLTAPIPAAAARTLFFVAVKLSASGATSSTVIAMDELAQVYAKSTVGQQWAYYQPITSTSGTVTNWTLNTLVFASVSSLTFRKNAVAGSTIAPDNAYSTSTGMTLFSTKPSGNHGDYDIAEVLLYGSLAASEIAAVEAYLNAKWAVY